MSYFKKNKIYSICFLLIFFSVFSIFAEDRQPIVLAFQENFFSTDKQLSFVEDLREAFHRIGYEMIMNFYPGKRCMLMADEGEVDGLPSKAGNLNDFYNNLIPVDVPVSNVTFAAYAMGEDVQGDGWASLRESTYSVLYRWSSECKVKSRVCFIVGSPLCC